MSVAETRVVFFQVRDPKAKVEKLAMAASSHFERKERFLILAENQAAVQYIDELLWKTPKTSFLPHFAVTEKSESWVAITAEKRNVNEARFVFNLCPTPLFIEGPFRIIYEFEDLSSPAKQQLSQIRFDAYKKANHLIEAR
jgi:DNA polymerase IIIc chi subunit